MRKSQIAPRIAGMRLLCLRAQQKNRPPSKEVMKLSLSPKKLAALCLLALGIQSGYSFRVVGYFPSWQGSVSGIQFSKVTHVNYAFLLPNSNGSLQTIDNASKLQSLVTAAHNAGVKVSISVGGWNNGDDSAFVSIAGNSSYRTTFVNNLVNFVNQYNLDGVDIDWEYPSSSSESANYTTLMGQLASAMHSRGKILTAAVIAYGSTGDYISSTVFGDVDWLNIMDYDNTSGVGQSTYSSAITAINYWCGTRGMSKSKAELGVPFYSDPSDYAFWDLLNRGADPYSDSWGSEGYNGITTIQNKTHYAVTNGIGGMMIWELSQDATGTYSLLSAMYNTIQQYSGGGGSLPSGWTDADIGSVGVSGSASYSSGTFTVKGAGADIWNTADGFNYVYQSASGDTAVVARVASESGSSSYAKAGVMIRESTSSGSIEASTLLTSTNGVAMEVRSTTGAATINVAGWVRGIKPPQWVKIARSGNTFTASYSADGSTWTQIASTNVSMASSTIVGLAVTSHDTSSLNTSTFDNVSVGSGGGGIDTSAIYQIENEASGWVLNNQGSLTNGSKITQWNSVSSDNLRWTFIPTDSGYYQINSVKSGLDAVVQSASTSQGAGIIQWSFGAAQNDQWQPVQNGDGSYTFYNRHSGLVLEDPASSTNKTTQMDQWGANGGDNQKWTLIKQ